MSYRYKYECSDCERKFLSDRSPEAAGFHRMSVVMEDPPVLSPRKRSRKRPGIWVSNPAPEGELGQWLWKVSGMGLRIQCPYCGGNNLGYRGESGGTG